VVDGSGLARAAPSRLKSTAGGRIQPINIRDRVVIGHHHSLLRCQLRLEILD
jgi:hypothetical protein